MPELASPAASAPSSAPPSTDSSGPPSAPPAKTPADSNVLKVSKLVPLAAAPPAPALAPDDSDVHSGPGAPTSASGTENDTETNYDSAPPSAAAASQPSSGGSQQYAQRRKSKTRVPSVARKTNASLTGNEPTQSDTSARLKTMISDNARPLADAELAKVCAMLREAIALREKYNPAESERLHDLESVTPSEDPPNDPFLPAPYAGLHFSFEMRRGIMVVWEETDPKRAGPRGVGRTDDKPPAFEQPPSLHTYTRDLARLLAITSDAAVNSFCYRRLQKLEARFKLHVMEQEHAEAAEQREQHTTPAACAIPAACNPCYLQLLLPVAPSPHALVTLHSATSSQSALYSNSPAQALCRIAIFTTFAR